MDREGELQGQTAAGGQGVSSAPAAITPMTLP